MTVLTEIDTGREGIANRVLSRLMALKAPLETWGAPAVDLFLRALMFRAFFNSGMTKVQDWQNTLLLFEYEYMVPVLSPNVAAVLATATELTMPVLILLGLFTRFAALPLLGMALVIQFVLGAANPAYSNVEHFYWMAILLFLITRGAGPVSLDRLLARRLGA